MTEWSVAPTEDALLSYKRLLYRILDQRPSGMRQRLAQALGKNRSFVTQISNPSYPTPIPARHLETIFEVCHFSPQERQLFLAAYTRAHPRHARLAPRVNRHRNLTLRVPDLGNRRANQRFDQAIQEFVTRLYELFEGR